MRASVAVLSNPSPAKPAEAHSQTSKIALLQAIKKTKGNSRHQATNERKKETYVNRACPGPG